MSSGFRLHGPAGLTAVCCWVKSNSSHKSFILYTCQGSTMLEAVNRGPVLLSQVWRLKHHVNSQTVAAVGTEAPEGQIRHGGENWGQITDLQIIPHLDYCQTATSRQVCDSLLRCESTSVQQRQQEILSIQTGSKRIVSSIILNQYKTDIKHQ